MKTAPAAPARKRAAPRKRAKAGLPRPLDQDVQEQESLILDFPQPGEVVTSRQYTLRLSAPEENGTVEVSIDESSWQPARFSVGHWWYDWSDYLAGEHRLRARWLAPAGGEALVERACLVSPQDADLL